MPAPDLPQELVDEITDHLHDVPAALAACTLVGRAWLQSARRRLYYTISITPRNCAGLTAHPNSFAPYVRTLLVLQDWLPPAASFAENEAHEAALERTLPHAARFACVRVLATHPHTRITALHVHTVFLDQFLAALPSGALACVEELALWSKPWGAHIATLVQLIVACPRLRRLALRGSVLWDYTGTAEAPTATLSARLEEFELDAGLSVHLFAEWLQNQDISALRTLRIPTNFTYPIMQQLVQSAAPSLVRLDIDTDTASQLDFTQYTQLRTLTLILSALLHPPPHFGNLLAAADTLRLDTVALDLTRVDSLNAAGLLDLPGLDAVLVHFPVVPGVRVLTSEPVGAAERVQLCSLMEECHAHGVLSFGQGSMLLPTEG